MNEITRLSTSFTTGFAILAMAAYLAGAWVCFAHRKLSPWLAAASLGFVGEVLASGLGQFAAVDAPTRVEAFLFFDLCAGASRVAATVVLVLALTIALADIRHKLAVSMEPKHARR